MAKLSELSSFAAKSLPPGAIVAVALGSVPDGCLACDGSVVSRATYKNLFDVIGTTFGVGDGSTTFGLPDLRGVFIRGTGSQIVSGTTYDGSTLGTKRRDRTNNSDLSALTTSTNSASVSQTNLSHTHTWTDRYYAAPLESSPNLSVSVNNPLQLISYTNPETGRTTLGASISMNHTHTVATNTVTSSTSLGGGGTETVPGHLNVQYAIKV